MNARTSGLLKIVVSGIAYAVILTTVLKHGLANSTRGGPFKIIALGTPGAIAIAGLIELITGIQFQRLSEAWDGLAGWQRGVLGLLIVVAAFGLMILGVAAFA